MTQNIEDLYIKFLDIKDRGWIKTFKSGFNGSGYTFETLLGIKENYLDLPDYEGIEIKTQKKNGTGKLSLLNINPKAQKGDAIEIILNKLGYPDRDYPDYKVFNVSLYANEIKKCGNNYISINVNDRMKRIELCIQDYEKNELDLNVHWPYALIQERLYKKLTFLAVIKYEEKEEEAKYIRYDQINVYKFKSFYHFIKLMKKGKIRISFKIGLHKDGELLGQTYNRGISFDVFNDDLEEMFKKVL
ncbi:MAG: hypothetical protein IKQ35_02305 [Bacilli bacterium]|nr:hypothetical protein [Bacilli bacterium]